RGDGRDVAHLSALHPGNNLAQRDTSRTQHSPSNPSLHRHRSSLEAPSSSDNRVCGAIFPSATAKRSILGGAKKFVASGRNPPPRSSERTVPTFTDRRLVVFNLLWLALPLLDATSLRASPIPGNQPQFSVSFAKERSTQPLDARILLLLSTDGTAEPRTQISISFKTQMVFGLDVDALAPKIAVTVDDAAFGYPIRYLRDVPAGDYFVQAVLNRYETFHRSDGHTVKMHMDQGERQHWNPSPGNLYSK